MKRSIEVHRGEVMAGQGDVVLKSDTDRPCLVIAAYDEAKKIGCLAHTMFLSGRTDKSTYSPVVMGVLKSIDEAIDEMIKDMTFLGASRKNIRVRLVSGENIPHEKDDPIYDENIASAMEVLRQKHVECDQRLETDTGNFHVSLDVETGTISYT